MIRSVAHQGGSWRSIVKAGIAAAAPRSRLLVRGATTSPFVCLTFDDGPHPAYTPELLDVLKDIGIRATFFVIGREAERYPEMVRRMAAEGHQVGNHTYSHGDPRLTPPGQLADEVRRTRTLIGGITGTEPYLFRPPKGELTVAKLWRLWRLGQSVVLWSVDPKDFSGPSLAEVSERLDRLPINGGDIILLHDNWPYAAQLVPGIAKRVSARGLAFAAVGALAG